MDTQEQLEYGTFGATLERSRQLARPAEKPRYQVLTGDRPTGRLHIGHYFQLAPKQGRLQKRVCLHSRIADYRSKPRTP